MNHVNTQPENLLESDMLALGKGAKEAAKNIASASGAQKNSALLAISKSLLDSRDKLLEANALDLEAAQASGLDSALIDRLRIDENVINAMAVGCQQVADLADPVGEISELRYRPSGIQVGKMRVPLGVIGIIYESRPNVTIDAAILCLKSGNATILRGGSEAFHSNHAIAACIAEGLIAADLDPSTVSLLKTTDRSAVGHLITMSDYVDMIIPRGGKGLIERVSREASVPVLKHLDGICHVYIDAEADLDKAHRIAINSKTHRYGVCNAMETLLVHRSIAGEFLPSLFAELTEIGVELRVCKNTKHILSDDSLIDATSEDWDTEYLAPILSVRIVDALDQAIEHIANHGSDHTESIVTENITRARRFLSQVDSSSVMVNTSTRFADGFEYGLGAEIGISTNKLHARGPVGLQGLTTQKYVVYGDGQIRE